MNVALQDLTPCFRNCDLDEVKAGSFTLTDF